MSRIANRAAVRRELPAAKHIPYLAQVSDHLIKTAAGDFVQVFRLRGAGFEVLWPVDKPWRS